MPITEPVMQTAVMPNSVNALIETLGSDECPNFIFTDGEITA